MKKILFLLMLLCCLNSSANVPLTHVAIWAKDGSCVAYALSEKPKIMFVNDKLVITTDKVNVSYDLSLLSNISYEISNVSGVLDISGDNNFEFQNDALVFLSLSENSSIRIFTTDGKEVLAKQMVKGGSYALSLSFLTPGTYVVNVNGLTYKILKR